MRRHGYRKFEIYTEQVNDSAWKATARLAKAIYEECGSSEEEATNKVMERIDDHHMVEEQANRRDEQ